MENLVNSCEFAVVGNFQSAATSDFNSSSVDMDDAESVCFVVTFGAITSGAVTSVKLQQSSDDGASDAFADIEGTAQTVADTDDDTAFLLEIEKPRERYVRCVVDRGTQNAEIENILAIKQGARKLPVTQGSTVGGSEITYSPAEGTA